MVSHHKGEEAERTLRGYAQLDVEYDVIFDPTEPLAAGPLRVDGQHEGAYRQLAEGKLPTVR